MDAMTEMERVLGAEAVRSLEQRHLLWDVAGFRRFLTADDGVRLDRTIGVVLGLAAGNADGDHRVGVETQTFVLSAEAWLDHGRRAPEVLAEQLSRELHTLRDARGGNRYGSRRATATACPGTSPRRRRSATPRSGEPQRSARRSLAIRHLRRSPPRPTLPSPMPSATPPRHQLRSRRSSPD